MDFNSNQQFYGQPMMGMPMGTGNQYNAYNQFGQPQVRNNLLDADAINLLMKKENNFSLALTQPEIMKSQCTHRTIDGLHDALVEEEDGTVRCSICGYKFRPLSESTSIESIQESVNEIVDVLQTIKLLWIDINPEPAKEYFPVIPLVEKIPELFKLAASNFAKHGNLNPWSYNNGNMSTMQLFQMLSGMINGTAPMNGFQQASQQAPQFYGQPQAPFGMPMSNGFGYMGGYQPQTDGFATQYGAPVATVAPTPVAADANTTADAAATKA